MPSSAPIVDGEDTLVTVEHQSVVLDGVGHWPHVEDPGTVAALVVDWLGNRSSP